MTTNRTFIVDYAQLSDALGRDVTSDDDATEALVKAVGEEILPDTTAGYIVRWSGGRTSFIPRALLDVPRKETDGQLEKPRDLQYPTKTQMAKNLGKEALSVIKRAVKGRAIRVPDAVRAERLATCKACEFFDQERSRCTKCGCKMPYKVGLASGRCPLPEPKWSEWDVESESQAE